jgi:hypothetical protein
MKPAGMGKITLIASGRRSSFLKYIYCELISVLGWKSVDTEAAFWHSLLRGGDVDFGKFSRRDFAE